MRRKMQRRAQIAKLRKFLTTDIILSGRSYLDQRMADLSPERPHSPWLEFAIAVLHRAVDEPVVCGQGKQTLISDPAYRPPAPFTVKDCPREAAFSRLGSPGAQSLSLHESRVRIIRRGASVRECRFPVKREYGAILALDQFRNCPRNCKRRAIPAYATVTPCDGKAR